MLTQIGSYNTFPIMAIIGNCKAGFGDTTAMETIEAQNKQIAELQEKLFKADTTYVEIIDALGNIPQGTSVLEWIKFYKDSVIKLAEDRLKVSRRNLLIKNKDKRIKELESKLRTAYITAKNDLELQNKNG